MKLLRRVKRVVSKSTHTHIDRRYPHCPSQVDLSRVAQTGLTMRAKLLAVTEVGPDKQVPDPLSRQFRRKIRFKKSIKVLVTVATTRIHIVRNDPWELLHDTPIDNLTFFDTKYKSPRLFYYACKDPDTGRITAYYLKTRKRDKETRNADRINDAVVYASSRWARKKMPEHPRVAALRRRHALIAQGVTVVDSATEQVREEVSPGELEPEHPKEKEEQANAVDVGEAHAAPRPWNRGCSSERECGSRIMTGPQFGFLTKEESMSGLSYASV